MAISVYCAICQGVTCEVGAELIGRRGNCPKCNTRIFVADLTGEAKAFLQSSAAKAGRIKNCSGAFKTKAVRCDKANIQRLLGSSALLALYCWLVESDSTVMLEVGGQRIGQLSAADSRRYIAHEIHARNFVHLAAPAKLFLDNGKFELVADIPCFEKPVLPQPIELPISAVDKDLLGILGKAQGVYGLELRDVTLHETIQYLMAPDDRAHEYQSQIRTRCPDAKFFSSPSMFFKGESVDWTSNDRGYGVELDLRDGRVHVARFQRLADGYFRFGGTQDPRIWRPIEVEWFT